MGLDLTVAPISYEKLDWWLCSNRMSLDRNYDLFCLIYNIGNSSVRPVCSPVPIPTNKKVQWYGDEGLEDRTTDPYGNPLTYLPANEFRKIPVPERTSVWNKAILIMLQSLPSNTPVILYWH